MAVLKADGLEKSYRGRQVVKGVKIKIKTREVAGLLGPNGAGKTTVFYMLAGIIRADAGSVSLNGKDITALPLSARVKHGLTYLPQERSVFQGLSVKKNLSAVLEMLDISKAEIERRTEKYLAEFDLEHVESSLARELSGGEARRLEIARAIAVEPDFLLMDEPFAGVDPMAVSMIQDIIRRLKGLGMGILISDHNVKETLKVCDHAFIMNEGEVLVSGAPDELAKSPEARAVYLGERFRL